jgi:membrane protease YdiL (CAAX protease family)
MSTEAVTGEERQPSRPLALLLWAGLAGLQIAATFSLADPDRVEEEPPIYEWATAANAIIVYGLLVLLTLGIASMYPDTRKALGLRRFESRYLWHAAAVVVVSIVVAAVLEPILHAGEKQGIAPQEWRPDDLAPFLVNAILIATWGPFAEELFYRGLGVTALGMFGPAVAICGTAIAFGFAHGLLVALPPLVVFGLGLAWVRSRADSVWPPFIAHAAYNALGIGIAVATSM